MQKRKNDPELVRKRLENSLPCSLSRWLSRVIRGKRCLQEEIRSQSSAVAMRMLSA